MPIGVLVDCSCVLLGGTLGAIFAKYIPKRVKDNLPKVFGVCGMCLGIKNIIQVNTMSAVVLAVLLGTAIGELLYLDRWINRLGGLLQKPAERIFTVDKEGMTQEEFAAQFVTLIVLFCASGTGIFGALQSGMTGDHSVLLSKAMLDFFTAMIFATRMGLPVAAVSIPQCIVMLILFYGSALIMPFTTETILADFSACGGALMFATGLKMAGLLDLSLASLLPAMVLIFPLSALMG